LTKLKFFPFPGQRPALSFTLVSVKQTAQADACASRGKKSKKVILNNFIFEK
jgi:hypothetical protein